MKLMLDNTNLPRTQVVTDEIANLLDDLAALGVHWARNREKGRMPNAIRTAMVETAEEIVMRIENRTDIMRRPLSVDHEKDDVLGLNT